MNSTEVIVAARLEGVYGVLRKIQAQHNEFETRCKGSGNCCRIGLVISLAECWNIARNIRRTYWMIAEDKGQEEAELWYLNLVSNLKEALYDNTWDPETHEKMFHCVFYNNGCTIYEYRPMVCFGPETKYLTPEGYKELGQTVGTKQKVLGSNGSWINGTVKSFGRDKLLKVTLTRNSVKKTIFATPDHVWFLRPNGGGSEEPTKRVRESRVKIEGGRRTVRTSQLEPGDRLAISSFNTGLSSIIPGRIGVMEGFVYGDGTIYSDQTRPCTVDLFHNGKDEVMLDYFSGFDSVSYGPDDKYSVGRTHVRNLPRAWKQGPDLEETRAHLLGWLAGYFLADGSMSGNSPRISSTNYDSLKLVERVCLRLGIRTFPITESERFVKVGGREYESTLFEIALCGDDTPESMFLNPKHLESFRTRTRNSRIGWTVESVEDVGRESEVFCVETEEGNHLPAFTLEDYILTHNCRAYGMIAPVQEGVCPRKRLPDGGIELLWDDTVQATIDEFDSVIEFWGEANPQLNYSIYMPAGVLKFLLPSEELQALIADTDEKFWMGALGYKHQINPSNWTETSVEIR